MAGLSLSDEVIDIYFGHYLRDLDVDSKKRVIAKFVESLVSPPPAPEPEPSMTLDELIEKWGPWDSDPWGYEERTEEPIQDVSESQVRQVRPDKEDQ
jgi:hypothetical protein